MRDTGILDRLRSRGQEMLTQVSAELSQNPRFMQAMSEPSAARRSWRRPWSACCGR